MATRVGMIQTADAEILGSTAFEALANELRFGQNIKVDADGKYVLLDSATYGLDAKIIQNKGKLKYGDDDENQILSDAAYSGLTISGLKFELKADGSIKISLEVSGKKGKLWSGDLAVTPLNGTPESTST